LVQVKRLACGCDRQFHIGLVARGNMRNHLSVGRIENLEGLA
jgi:hypothetical protein